MKRRSRRLRQGFTLIELLIVIAIIAILAAVLIPQLLGARTSANKRAIQAHSANVYKALVAALADSPSVAPTDVVTATGGTDCKPAKATITIDGVALRYGWQAAPGAVASCVYAAVDGDFRVTVTGDPSTDGYVSVNGQPGV